MALWKGLELFFFFFFKKKCWKKSLDIFALLNGQASVFKFFKSCSFLCFWKGRLFPPKSNRRVMWLSGNFRKNTNSLPPPKVYQDKQKQTKIKIQQKCNPWICRFLLVFCPIVIEDKYFSYLKNLGKFNWLPNTWTIPQERVYNAWSS